MGKSEQKKKTTNDLQKKKKKKMHAKLKNAQHEPNKNKIVDKLRRS